MSVSVPIEFALDEDAFAIAMDAFETTVHSDHVGEKSAEEIEQEFIERSVRNAIVTYLIGINTAPEPVEWNSYSPHPSTWRYDPRGQIVWGASAKGGDTRVLDIRGWGYLTGKGHGALGLDNKTACADQDALGQFVVDACKAAVTPPSDIAKADMAPLLEALQTIASGSLPGMVDLVLAGSWQGVVELMQRRASATLRLIQTKEKQP